MRWSISGRQHPAFLVHQQHADATFSLARLIRHGESEQGQLWLLSSFPELSRLISYLEYASVKTWDKLFFFFLAITLFHNSAQVCLEEGDGRASPGRHGCLVQRTTPFRWARNGLWVYTWECLIGGVQFRMRLVAGSLNGLAALTMHPRGRSRQKKSSSQDGLSESSIRITGTRVRSNMVLEFRVCHCWIMVVHNVLLLRTLADSAVGRQPFESLFLYRHTR